jgi:iron complex transport system substrate-binding protein
MPTINRQISLLGLILFQLLLCGLLISPPAAAEIPDAQDARSVFGATPPSTFTLYAFDPELVAGWNTPLRLYEKKYIFEKYQRLPILGGWYGEGFIPDREVLLASGLKKAFFLVTGWHDQRNIGGALAELGMEIIVAPAGLDQTPECFFIMGEAFNRPERGRELAAYARKALAGVKEAMASLPEDDRPSVYFGLEADGLATACRGSSRSEALELAGGRNVHECLPGAENASTHITFEQLLTYDPEHILIYDPNLFASIPGHRLWSRLSAVRNGRVYLVPRGPFSWLERPASYMRLIGVQWLANILHPERFPLDAANETKVFIKLFFNVDLNDRDVAELLNS